MCMYCKQISMWKEFYKLIFLKRKWKAQWITFLMTFPFTRWQMRSWDRWTHTPWWPWEFILLRGNICQQIDMEYSYLLNGKRYLLLSKENLKCIRSNESLSVWWGSVDWMPACKLKGHQFDSHSRHMLVLWARSPVEGEQETTNQCISLTSMFLSPSFFPFLSL